MSGAVGDIIGALDSSCCIIMVPLFRSRAYGASTISRCRCTEWVRLPPCNIQLPFSPHLRSYPTWFRNTRILRGHHITHGKTCCITIIPARAACTSDKILVGTFCLSYVSSHYSNNLYDPNTYSTVFTYIISLKYIIFLSQHIEGVHREDSEGKRTRPSSMSDHNRAFIFQGDKTGYGVA